MSPAKTRVIRAGSSRGPASDIREPHFRLLVDNVKDYAIFMLDPEGHVSSWNPGAERIKGYKADEIIGRHFSTFYPQEDKDAGKPAWELKVAARDGRFEDEGWRLRKDGSRFWANVVISAVRDADGHLVGSGKVTRDLTEHHWGAGENFAKIFRMTPVALSVSTDANRRFVDVNEEFTRLTGYTRKELIGREVTDIHSEIQDVQHSAPLENREMPIRTKSGETVSTLVSADLIDFGGQKCVLAAFRDISEAKKVEAERVVQQAAIRQLSTPVLQVRNRLLILPLIGVIDAQRARQVNEQLLASIRNQRARAVVIDITGVATMDTFAANHIIKTADAARLLGATVILSGISRPIAQTLVETGVDLRKLTTVGDLQSGIEEAERLVGRAAEADAAAQAGKERV